MEEHAFDSVGPFCTRRTLLRTSSGEGGSDSGRAASSAGVPACLPCGRGGSGQRRLIPAPLSACVLQSADVWHCAPAWLLQHSEPQSSVRDTVHHTRWTDTVTTAYVRAAGGRRGMQWSCGPATRAAARKYLCAPHLGARTCSRSLPVNRPRHSIIWFGLRLCAGCSLYLPLGSTLSIYDYDMPLLRHHERCTMSCGGGGAWCRGGTAAAAPPERRNLHRRQLRPRRRIRSRASARCSSAAGHAEDRHHDSRQRGGAGQPAHCP